MRWFIVVLAALLVVMLAPACDEEEGEPARPTPSPSAIATPSPEATPSPSLSPTGEPTPTPENTPTAEATPTAEPSVLQWRELSPPGPLPPPRRDYSLVTDGQQVLLFGGRGEDTLADLWTFDLSNGTWSEITTAQGPPARFGHNAIFDADSSRMLVFGGQAGSTFFNDVWTFDLTTGEWSELQNNESIPSPRYGAASALDPSGRLLVSHGFTDAGRFDDTWAFSLGDEVWEEVSLQGERPLERCLVRAVWDTNAERLLMFGGQATGVPFLGDLWELRKGAWLELGAEPKPSPRNFYAMVFDDDAGQAVLLGGNTQDGPANDLWFFDSASDTWSQQAPADEGPSPRFGHDAVWLAASRSLFVFGGNDGSQNLNDSWKLSLPSSQ